MSSDGARKRQRGDGGDASPTPPSDVALAMAQQSSTVLQLQTQMVQLQTQTVELQHAMADRLSKIASPTPPSDVALAMAQQASTVHHLQTQMVQLQTQTVELQDAMADRLSKIDELEEKCSLYDDKCTVLVARCGALERSLLSLAKGKEWEYPLPPIPSGYWKERRINFNDGRRKDQLVGLLRDETCILRRGEHCQQARLEFGPYACASVVAYDDIMLPYWREYADALLIHPRPTSGQLGSFSAICIQLPPVVLDMLAPALRGRGLKSFQLVENEFPDVRCGIDFAIQVLQGNPNLVTFRWEDNHIDRPDYIDHFVEGIQHLHSLENLYLAGFNDTDVINTYDALCSLLSANKKCRLIDFDRNFCRYFDPRLSSILAENPPLQTLRLEDNSLRDIDARVIADGLKHNTNLRELHLGENLEITDIGRNALRKAIFDRSSLAAVVSSNHTCCLWEPHCRLDATQDNAQESPGQNLSVKMYALLSSWNKEGTNVHHLRSEIGGDDVVNLMPRIFERIVRSARIVIPEGDEPLEVNGGVVPPLSVVYEILRNWKLPPLLGLV